MFSLLPRRLFIFLVGQTLLPFLILINNPIDNHPPVAGDDSFTVHGCRLMHVTDNDSDPDNDPIFVNGFPTLPAHGTLSNNGNGNLFYCTNVAYVGSDSFVYQLCDPQNACTTATVTLNDVNQPPNGVADFFNVHGFTVVGPLLANDSDPDGDGITCGGSGQNCLLTLPQHGSLTGVATDRWAYNPNSGFSGPDSFTYNVCDSLGLCTPTVVNLSVNNNVPIAGNDQYIIPGPSTRIGPLRGNDSDPDGDSISEPNLLTFPQHGSLFGLTVDIKIYTPNPGFAGTDNFTYQICDSLGKCATATVTLWVIGEGTNLGLCNSCNGAVGSPINVTTGNMYLQQNDYQLPSVGPGLNVTRTYNSQSQRIGLFGRGWSSPYDESILAYDSNLVRFNHSGGRSVYLGRPSGSSGAFTDLIGDLHEQVTQGASGFTLTMKDGSVEQFNSAGKLLSLTDRNGNTTSLAYDANGFLSSVTDPFGRVLTVNTNANGQVTSIVDSLGTIASYTYGASNELLSVTYADNSAFNFTYDSSLRLTTATDTLGNITESHSYDGQGRATTSEKQGGIDHYSLSYVSATETDVTDGLGRITKYTFDTSKIRNVVTRVEGLCSCGGGDNSQVQTWSYDNQLNVMTQTDALGHVTSYSYDANGNRLTETDPTGTITYTYNGFAEVLTLTDQMNNVTTNTYDVLGNLLTTTDALNNPTTFTYNAAGLMLTVTNARGKVTTFTYDASGNLTQRKDANNNITFFFYDARRRLTKIRDAANRSTLFAYDAFSRLNKVTHPDSSFISFTYDLAGRRTRVTDERNNPTNYGYDGAYRLISVTNSLNNTTTYSYDSMSNPTSVTDALSRTTNYDFDEFNRLIKVTYPPATTGATRLFETTVYDAAGNVTSRTDTAGRVTSFVFDDVNRVTSTTDAASETTTFAYDALSRVTSLTDAINQQYQFGYDALGRQTSITRAGSSMTYAYDQVGNSIQRTDYNGVVTNYTYDDLNRLKTIVYPTRTVTYFYDALNNVERADNENGSIYFGYDNRYRLASVTDPFFYGISYNYDTVGNRTKLKVNGATYATYTYDSVNRLTNLADSANANFTYSYDAANRLTTRTEPTGVISTYAYDDLNRLTSLMHTLGLTTLSSNLYNYDNANNISSWATPASQRAFSYDAVDRLSSVSDNGVPVESYSYDAAGNRTTSHLSATYSYQPFNKLTSTASATYAYDNNGNLISKVDASGTTSYGYNEENQLTVVTLPSGLAINYKYDVLGRRIKRTTSSGANERYVYDRADALIDLNADWSVAATYLNGIGVDNHLRQTSATSGVSYFLTDHLGSTSALVDAGGNSLQQVVYDSFGESGGSTLTRYDYTGRERDPDTGLLYYRARYYDANTGRFTAEDPLLFNGGRNWYLYAEDNPIRFNDPFGLTVWLCSRRAYVGWPVANHAYFYDDRKGESCGLGGWPNPFARNNYHGSTTPEKGPNEGAPCRRVEGSEDPLKADAIMKCCRDYKSSTYAFWISDCHNLTNSCITSAGLRDPGAPGGRVGSRCIKCTQPPVPVAPPPPSAGRCWGGARGC